MHYVYIFAIKWDFKIIELVVRTRIRIEIMNQCLRIYWIIIQYVNYCILCDVFSCSLGLFLIEGLSFTYFLFSHFLYFIQSYLTRYHLMTSKINDLLDQHFVHVLMWIFLLWQELRFIISSLPIFNLAAAVAASRMYVALLSSDYSLHKVYFCNVCML